MHRGGRAAIAIAVATALALGSRASIEAAGTSAAMAEPAGAAALRTAETPSAANRA